MAVDITAISYFAPIFAFLIVFVVSYAVLFKTEILGDNKFIHALISFVIATMFVSFAGVREYVVNVIPWFAVLLVAAFLIFAMMGFVGTDSMKKGIGIVFVAALLIVFLITGYVVFSTQMIGFWDDISAYPRVLGAALLLIIGALVSWVLVKAN